MTVVAVAYVPSEATLALIEHVAPDPAVIVTMPVDESTVQAPPDAEYVIAPLPVDAVATTV